MGKYVLFLAIIHFTMQLNAQKKPKQQIIIFPKNEEAIVKIDNKEKSIKSIYFCKEAAKVEAIKGQISLLLQNGKEVQLDTGEIFTISVNNSGTNNVLFSKLAKHLNEPAVYLPNLLNKNREDNSIFPLISKLYDKKLICFYLSSELASGSCFKIYDYESDALIWQTKEPGNTIKPDQTKFRKGEWYSWKLYNGTNSIKGKFYVLNKQEKKGLKKFNLKKKEDYLNSYFQYLEHECLFDAIAILNKACQKYPESVLIKKLRSFYFIYN